jgi:deoxyhypusine monooxygenase
MVETVPTYEALRDALLDLSQPMGKRTRAVFYLRSRGQKEDLAVLLQGAFTVHLY